MNLNKRGLSVIILLTLCLFFANGCTPRSEIVTRTNIQIKDIGSPGPGEAIIVFVRPWRLVGSASAKPGAIFEVASNQSVELINVIEAGTHAIYRIKQGKHVFAIVGETADFLEIEATAGRMYLIEVVERWGVFEHRLSLSPVIPGSKSFSEKVEWLKGTDQVQLNERAKTWLKENKSDVNKKVEENWSEWISKSDRPKMREEDGVERL
jgi:hypothetical protein